MTGPVEVYPGVTLEPATQELVDYVTANYRREDREEHLCFSPTTHEDLNIYDQCWILRMEGDIVAFGGIMRYPGDSFISCRRLVPYMTCEAMNRHRKLMVRCSRTVLRWMIHETPKWVEIFETYPTLAYHGSIIWHERILKMRKIEDLTICGHAVRHFRITRKEVDK